MLNNLQKHLPLFLWTQESVMLASERQKPNPGRTNSPQSWSSARSQICSFLSQDCLHPTRPRSGRCSELSTSAQRFPQKALRAPLQNWPSFVFVRKRGFNWFVVSYSMVRSQCHLTSCLWDKRSVFIVCQAGCCYRKRALGISNPVLPLYNRYSFL